MNLPWLEPAQEEFANRLRNGRLAHACLLSGPRGLGKSALAQSMAATLLCLKGGDSACGECRSCEVLRGGAHPDFRLITYELNTSTDKMRTEVVIDQVRELNSVMHLTHSLSPRKVALINPAEAMNRNTANALLKTLEEPPGDSVILLVSHDPSRLPATIRSRCQSFHVRLPEERVAVQWLMDVSGCDAGLARDALGASAGGPLVAQSLIANGAIDRFRELGNVLNRVQDDETTVNAAMETCASVDQDDLWTWISLLAARRLRTCLGLVPGSSGETTDASTDSTRPGLARQVAQLQTLADRNRRAQSTQLRKDLLLRDWLIQWSRLANT